MDWRYKALTQSALAFVPAGDRINYLFQRHVTKNLPVGDEKFSEIVALAGRHLDLLRKYGRRPIEEAMFYEFGAGWDLIVPLSFYASGVNRQILVDLRRLARPALVNDTIDRLAAVSSTLGLPRQPRQHVPSGQEYFAVLERKYGITYQAPADARDTGLQAGSIDYITSTNTLEHVPADDILPILKECHRLLRPDGVMTSQVDYQDHYAFFDGRISVYNYLRYSDRSWRRYSQSIHYQNRLRHPDYLQLIQEAGFRVLETQPDKPSPEDLRMIDTLPLDSRFQGYDRQELGIRSAFFALRPAPA